jgi:hypothetical protein
MARDYVEFDYEDWDSFDPNNENAEVAVIAHPDVFREVIKTLDAYREMFNKLGLVNNVEHPPKVAKFINVIETRIDELTEEWLGEQIDEDEEDEDSSNYVSCGLGPDCPFCTAENAARKALL